MLDHNAPWIRSDRLRKFIQDQKQEAEQRQIEAIESDLKAECFTESGKIEAYEELLWYLSEHEQTSQ